MNSSTRSRAIRVLISAMMASDLRPNEIQEVSDALQKDETFSREIGLMLKDFVSSMERIRYKRAPKFRTPHYEAQSDFAQRALMMINKRRLSKKTIWAMIKLLKPQSAHFFIEEDSTLRDTLSLFEKKASQRQIDKFLTWLQPSSGSVQPNELFEVLKYAKENSLNKKDMIRKLGEFLPETADLTDGDRLSVKEILGVFLDCASDKQAKTFMKWVRGDISPYADDYLKGIMKER